MPDFFRYFSLRQLITNRISTSSPVSLLKKKKFQIEAVCFGRYLKLLKLKVLNFLRHQQTVLILLQISYYFLLSTNAMVQDGFGLLWLLLQKPTPDLQIQIQIQSG